MTAYDEKVRSHLATYKEQRLGVRAPGVHLRTGRAYRHILPLELRQLNIFESIRADFFEYLSAHCGTLHLHRDFHHVNSSQALAFNLFFPYFRDEPGAGLLLAALGPKAPLAIKEFHFEYVPDASEATNVDVAWRMSDDTWTFCEVKLSERGFGKAKRDERHLRKLETTYRPRLQDLVESAFLEPARFFEHYQILRNISLLSTHAGSSVLFLLPKANERLVPALERVMGSLADSVRSRVHVTFLEEVIDRLEGAQPEDSSLATVPHQLREKYLPMGSGES
jgi:hypothetical protein